MSRMQLDAMLRRAQSALAANKLTQAHTICEQLIQKNPRSVSTLNLLGRIAFARSYYDQAAEHLEKSIAISPRDTRAHLILGELRSFQGRHQEAIAQYDKVLRLKPGEQSAIAGKADTWEKCGEREKARSLLDHARPRRGRRMCRPFPTRTSRLRGSNSRRLARCDRPHRSYAYAAECVHLGS